MNRSTSPLLIGGAVLGLIMLANSVAAASPPERRPPPSPPAPGWPPTQPPNPAGLTHSSELTRTIKPGAESSWPRERKLAAAHPNLRLPDLLDRLRARGFQPVISNTWRALTTQDLLLAQGLTKVSFSFHNAVDEQGYPRALAADLIDARYGFGEDSPSSEKTVGAARFFVALGQSARALGLTWGGDWERRGYWAPFGIGWDPVHVQALPNERLPAVRDACLPRILGQGLVKAGSGGYRYRQWPNGYVQIVEGGTARGELILPRGDRAVWTAITGEIGPYPGRGVA